MAAGAKSISAKVVGDEIKLFRVHDGKMVFPQKRQSRGVPENGVGVGSDGGERPAHSHRPGPEADVDKSSRNIRPRGRLEKTADNPAPHQQPAEMDFRVCYFIIRQHAMSHLMSTNGLSISFCPEISFTFNFSTLIIFS